MISSERLNQIIEEALELESGTIDKGVEDWQSSWDSLGHLSILVNLDKELDGRCSNIADLSGATNIDSLKIILIKHNLLIS